MIICPSKLKFIFSLKSFDWIMRLRLCCKMKQVNSVMLQCFFIISNTVYLCGKYIIAQSRCS